MQRQGWKGGGMGKGGPGDMGKGGLGDMGKGGPGDMGKGGPGDMGKGGQKGKGGTQVRRHSIPFLFKCFTVFSWFFQFAPGMMFCSRMVSWHLMKRALSRKCVALRPHHKVAHTPGQHIPGQEMTSP